MRRLKECNNTIVIYSCRSNPDCVEDHIRSTEEMISYLNHWDLPFDRVEYGKPFFNFYIDDRNLGVPLDKNYNVDWEGIEKLID
jgi:succinate dehydrogenase/fumarate reductase flavoprotein subunit